jgi:signal transduction histidine kinase
VRPFLGDDRRAKQLRKLTQVSRALTNATSLEEVLDLVVRRAAELMDAPKVVLLLVNEDGLLSVRASQGIDTETSDRFREPLQETLVDRLSGLLGSERDGFLAVPLVVGGDVSGVLAVSGSAHGDAEEDEWLLSALADQAALALEKTRLDRAVEFRERLIGIVSHDLRNPLSAILYGAENLLRREELDEKTTKTAARIRSSAERALRLTHDLLDFTQARLGGHIPIERKPGDLNDIVRQVVQELQVAHADRNVVVDLAPEARGAWDADRIAQILGNLLGNALQYSTPGTPILVATRTTGDSVALCVRNEGPTIPPALLTTVFEPLQRVADRDRASRGVGLGLYIVKHLVEAHGGQVSVRSSDAEGTTFEAMFPRAEPRNAGA